MSDRTDPYHRTEDDEQYRRLLAETREEIQRGGMPIRDHYHLGRQFFGGSMLSGGKFPGLIHRVKRELHSTFRDPLPSSGGMRGDILQLGGSKGHDSYHDPVPLRDYLRDWLATFGDQRPGKHVTWLEEHPATKPIDKQECLSLVGMCGASVRILIGDHERNLATNEKLNGILGLEGAFASFLAIGGCEHALATTQDGATVCPSCGLTEVA